MIEDNKKTNTGKECQHDFIFLETIKHAWKCQNNYLRPVYGFSKADRFYCKKCLKIEIREMEYSSDDSREPSWY